jgi:uncharacterized lipoprotein YmbA
MIKLIPSVALVFLIALNGCASQPEGVKGEYRLPLLNSSPEQVCNAAQRQVVVSDLMLSDGILLQQSATRINAARQHRWSGSLEQQLQQSAQRVLSKPHCNGELVIQVMDFYGDNEGNAVVSGHWQYRYDDALIEQTFSQRQPLTSDGYEALVIALNQAWSDTLKQINDVMTQESAL